MQLYHIILYDMQLKSIKLINYKISFRIIYISSTSFSHNSVIRDVSKGHFLFEMFEMVLIETYPPVRHSSTLLSGAASFRNVSMVIIRL